MDKIEISDIVKEQIEEGEGFVVIIAGSDSDKDHIGAVIDSLKPYGLKHNTRICSAHKQPAKSQALIEAYDALDSPLAYVSIAGGTDALSGGVAYHSINPCISSPPDASPPDHNDSCLNNPPGSSNAYIARAKNVGKFLAQLFSHINPQCKEVLQAQKEKKIADLNKADEKYRVK